MSNSKASFTDMGWSEAQFGAANLAARTARHGHDEPDMHRRIETMTLKETEEYIALTDGWANAYEYAAQSGRLHHPKDGILLGEWTSTHELQEQFTRLERLARSITRRAMRHANKVGGSYHVEE